MIWIALLAAALLLAVADDIHTHRRLRAVRTLVLAPRHAAVTVLMRPDTTRDDLYRAEADIHRAAETWGAR